MKAMVLTAPGRPLSLEEVPCPKPRAGELLIRIEACGVCRTDLHIADGELSAPKLPLIMGHEIVGRVVGAGSDLSHQKPGRRVGVPWLGSTCGHCFYCRNESENLCDEPRFTGYTTDGGYAEYCVADHRYCFDLDERADPVSLAPRLCAGLIGYRALKLAGNARRIGIYGFGAAAHLVTQVAVFQGREIFAFTRTGDEAAQRLALKVGCAWAGGSGEAPPLALDAAIIFASAGELVPAALRAVRKGGTVVCGGIHMSPIPSFGYDLLWGERCLRSVANLTRQDAVEFLAIADAVPVIATTAAYALADANRALGDLRTGRVSGAAVLVP